MNLLHRLALRRRAAPRGLGPHRDDGRVDEQEAAAIRVRLHPEGEVEQAPDPRVRRREGRLDAPQVERPLVALKLHVLAPGRIHQEPQVVPVDLVERLVVAEPLLAVRDVAKALRAAVGESPAEPLGVDAGLGAPRRPSILGDRGLLVAGPGLGALGPGLRELPLLLHHAVGGVQVPDGREVPVPVVLEVPQDPERPELVLPDPRALRLGLVGEPHLELDPAALLPGEPLERLGEAALPDPLLGPPGHRAGGQLHAVDPVHGPVRPHDREGGAAQHRGAEVGERLVARDDRHRVLPVVSGQLRPAVQALVEVVIGENRLEGPELAQAHREFAPAPPG